MRKVIIGILIVLMALVIVFAFYTWLKPISSETLPRNDKIENTGLDKVPTTLPPRDFPVEKGKDKGEILKFIG